MIRFKEIVNGREVIREISYVHYVDPVTGVVHNIEFLRRKDITSHIRLLWEVVNSCFGSGYWINAKAWSNEDGWRNLP